MEAPDHSINALFDQLGLDSSDQAIERFLASQQTLPADVPLHQAPCWTPAQATFLREAVAEDADWAEVVDHLDALLHH